MEKLRTALRKNVLLVGAVSLSLMLAGCGSGSNSNQKANATPPTPAKSQFERDLEYVRRAQLTHTYVISRQDGAVLDGDDRQFISRNTPAETAHRLITDGNRRAIIGTNFDLYAENKKALEERFTVESYANR
ncbi:MAG: hypothetical protein WKF30_15075 [Pyrinomonadaceae bacterium]